jgi:hypothetical protein
MMDATSAAPFDRLAMTRSAIDDRACNIDDSICRGGASSFALDRAPRSIGLSKCAARNSKCAAGTSDQSIDRFECAIDAMSAEAAPRRSRSIASFRRSTVRSGRSSSPSSRSTTSR